MAAQVPPELREAMRARDEAVAKADAATWDRLTTDDFTVVLADGTLLTKGERLAQFKTQQATPPAPAQQEQIKHYGDVFVRRALRQVRDAGAAWVLDIWVKDAKGWRVKLAGDDPSRGSGVLCAGAHELSVNDKCACGRVARSLSAIR
jgi:hypothetical protein